MGGESGSKGVKVAEPIHLPPNRSFSVCACECDVYMCIVSKMPQAKVYITKF